MRRTSWHGRIVDGRASRRRISAHARPRQGQWGLGGEAAGQLTILRFLQRKHALPMAWVGRGHGGNAGAGGAGPATGSAMAGGTCEARGDLIIDTSLGGDGTGA